jgi:hypothetical protein
MHQKDISSTQLKCIPGAVWCGDTLLSRWSANATNSIGGSGKAGQEPSHGHQVVTATNTDHSHSHIAVSVRRLSQQTLHLVVLACCSRCTIGIEVLSRSA